jgi:Lar family restriction alleviation protein
MKLKPCPFCGASTGLIRKKYWLNHMQRFVSAIVCSACGGSTGGTDTSRDAAASWNERPKDKQK